MRNIREYVVAVFIGFILTLASGGSNASTLSCPDTTAPARHQEVMATSAPEIKARTASEDDSHRWTQIIKPLAQKAIKLAKEHRAAVMEDGIEHACESPQVYVGQILPVPDKPSGCDHRVITRPADDEHVWVQVVATCNYEWSCCTSDDSKMSRSGGSASYSLEGSVVSASSGTVKPKH
jgi:hypothetical protein